MEKVLVTGGSGLLGSYLIPLLKSQGFSVSTLSRDVNKNPGSFKWDIDKMYMDSSALNDTGTIIHLAGSGIIDKRWTTNYKKEILESRVNSAKLLLETIKLKPEKSVHTFISASAVGYYGDTGESWIEENFKGPEDFMGSVCIEWEKSARQFETLGIRVVILRIGIVLAKNGGALPPLALQLKLFAGAPIGTGKQFMSWIHVNDLCRMFSFSVSNKKVAGTFNAVAPGPVTNKQFMKSLASVVHRPLWPFPIPSFLMKIILGEKAQVILAGQRVSSEKIRRAGFEHTHTDLHETLKNILQ